MGGQEANPYVNLPSFNSRPQSPFAANASAPLYPQIRNESPQRATNPYVAMADSSTNNQVGAFEEHLVTIPGCIVHLVDDQESIFLGHGNFSVVRLNQQDEGIVALVRVGDGLQWPLMSDEQVVKLDPIHYVFSLPVAPTLDRVVEKSVSEPQVSGAHGGDNMHYGVTFSAPGQEEALKFLDEVLEYYSFFSLPTLVHGDKQKEAADHGLAPNAAGQVDTRGAAVVPISVVAGDGKQITEENQKVFWTVMAPNVDDYDNRMAKAIASGTGQIIRGIFWVRDATVERLEKRSINTIKNSKPADKPANIRPSTVRNLQRVKGMTKATDNFAKSVLSGVVTTVGHIPNAIAKSRPGRAFFKTGVGEVALASMVSFCESRIHALYPGNENYVLFAWVRLLFSWKVFDAVEQASKDVLKTGSTAATTVVTHKHGDHAGKATGEALYSAGHLASTAWSVAKVPKALHPTSALKPTRATIMGLHPPKPVT